MIQFNFQTSEIDIRPHSRGAMRPRFANKSCPVKIRGRGEAGRLMHPQPRMQIKIAYERSHHRFTGNDPAFPAQWFTAYSVISPAIRFLTPSLADLRQLDAAAEASGPHALAVRKNAPSSMAPLRVHRILPRVCDDLEPPLQWDRTGEDMPLIWGFCKSEYFYKRDLTGISDLPDG